MARRKKPSPWTSAEVKTIRSLAGRQAAEAIARRLKRSEGAIRQKALVLGISLRVR